MDTGRITDRPYRARVEVRKFHGDDQTGDPFEIVERAHWFEPDGTPITDDNRIAALERRLTQKDEAETWD